MMLFIAIIALITLVFAFLAQFVRKQVVSAYRGALFIVLSGFYFSLFFGIAYVMRERFQ